jgi:hypothetical protein
LRDDLPQVIDQLVIPELQRHDHGDPDHFRLDISVPVALDQGTKRIGAGVGVPALSRRLGLRQQEVGVEA